MSIHIKTFVMRIIAITDLHAKTEALKALSDQLQSSDLVLFCGDTTHFGHEREIKDILLTLQAFNPNVFGVTGNCEYPDAEKYLVAQDISLNMTFREFHGYCLFGLSGSLPCPGRTPNEYTEEEYEALLHDLVPPPGKPLLMVTHQPPCNTKNDEVSPGFHVGSKSIRQFIEKHRPLICFTGHIHEGIAIDYIGSTAVINPGPARGGNYAVAEVEGNTVLRLDIKHI
jgi:Icc-related predicted phosphoesterase